MEKTAQIEGGRYFPKDCNYQKEGKRERDHDRCNKKENVLGTLATNNITKNQKEQLLTFFACPSKAMVFWEVARTNPVSTAFRAFLAYRYAVARLQFLTGSSQLSR